MNLNYFLVKNLNKFKCISFSIFVLVLLDLFTGKYSLVQFGGLTVHLNPYNPNTLSKSRGMDIILSDLSSLNRSNNNFYPIFLPYAIQGSFKYFFYRYPHLEIRTAQAFCLYLNEKQSKKVLELRTYYPKNKVFPCI
jgi:hypothetical protein